MATLGPQDAERFRALCTAQFHRVLGYALKRAVAPEDAADADADADADAADAVAETSLVTWWRIDEVPPGDAAQLWIYGVARRVLANDHRSLGRRDRRPDDELAVATEMLADVAVPQASTRPASSPVAPTTSTSAAPGSAER